MLRTILAGFAGTMVAGICVSAIEAISSVLHPLPAGLDPKDTAALAAHITTLPLSAFVLVLLAWTVGVFVGGMVAQMIAKSESPRTNATLCWVVTAMILLGAIANMAMIPHPTWMMIAAPICILAAGFAATRARLEKAA